VSEEWKSGKAISGGTLYTDFIPPLFLPVSDFTRQMLIKAGVKENRIINTYNGVDIGKFDVSKWNKNAFRDEIGVSKDTVLVGTVGRVNYNKGQEVLIKAIPHILKKTSNFKVVIVGDGEKLEACKTLAKDLGVEEFVHFTGFRRDIPNIQAALDIYTLASVKGENVFQIPYLKQWPWKSLGCQQPQRYPGNIGKRQKWIFVRAEQLRRSCGQIK